LRNFFNYFRDLAQFGEIFEKILTNFVILILFILNEDENEFRNEIENKIICVIINWHHFKNCQISKFLTLSSFEKLFLFDKKE